MNHPIEPTPIDADLLTAGMRLTYLDFDDERHTITVTSVDKDPEFQVLSACTVAWEITDRDGDVWTLFVVDVDDSDKYVIDSVSPSRSSARYDVVDLRPIVESEGGEA